MESNEIKDLIVEAQRNKVTVLDLSFKNLASLPLEITELKNLTVLSISYNQLTSLPPEISELKNLTVLNISNNQLASLPPEISELKNLTELYVFNNNLTSLPYEISELESLMKLYLNGNKLTSLPSQISMLKNLTELGISNNQLTSLPLGISKLKNLMKLDISNNQLTLFPFEILDLELDINWELNVARGIFLGDNPLENLPLEIIKQGRESIINYFKSLEGELKPLSEVKVLLIGDGGAGKTSLVKRLFWEEVDGNEPQTQGINIRKWILENRGHEIKANFWDFGGQEIMHATHQFFLSKRSLYILVLDGRKDEKPEYWLKLIENFGGDSSVLVVINKIDENPAFELNRKFLQEKYPSIRDFYRLSCKSGEGFEDFSISLQEELKKVKHLEIKWPKSWFNVKNRLEKRYTDCSSDTRNRDVCRYFNFIEYKEYNQICDEEGIQNELEQNILADFLNDLGIILHFRDIPLLNTYVLEPEWVTNAVYKIVNSKEIAESGGVLKPDMLPKILRQTTENHFYYPPDQFNFIISLMKKFELSYDLDDHTLLIPSLLEIQQPDFTFDYEGSLKFTIDYDFLPSSVMPRFIVKMNRDIKDDLRWRTGVILEDKDFNSIALVRADNEAKRIRICVSGSQKRDYFSVILQRFREINDSFEKLKAIEKIMLPDEPEVTISFEHLIRLEHKGIEKYIPDGSDHEYDVRDLLGTVKIDVKKITDEEILQILRRLKDQADTEDTLVRKFLKAVSSTADPLGINFNELGNFVRLVLAKKD